MPLRQSPTLTPALLAANRRNARKSTGPRPRRGKAWARLNGLQHGGGSPEYLSFVQALMGAPPCRVGWMAEALLQAREVPHPLFSEEAMWHGHPAREWAVARMAIAKICGGQGSPHSLMAKMAMPRVEKDLCAEARWRRERGE